MSYIDVLNDAAARADAASTKATAASDLLDEIVNGPEETFVMTDNGPVPTAATAIEDLRSQITAGTVAPIRESVTLGEDQVNVTFENIQTSGISLYIDDGTADAAYRYFNFTVDGTNSVILDDVFPAGTVVHGLSQEIGGEVGTAVDQTQANAQLAEDWATLLGGTVDGDEFSSKYYAQESASSASAAATSESNAATSASESETSANLSEDWATLLGGTVDGTEYSAKYYSQESSTFADNAASSASDASDSASAAATSESNAADSANAAATSASEASTSASEAATSASNAEDSETLSANSASLSEDWATKLDGTVDGTEYSSKYYSQESSASASAAETSESNAADSATAAATSESNAATSAANAEDSATAAATSAANAEDSKDAAASSASNAASSADSASTSASEASTSASEAESSAQDAANTYDQFDDRYLGSKSSDPTTDNDGGSLITGALYWSTSENVLKIWSGSDWRTFEDASNVGYDNTESELVATNVQQAIDELFETKAGRAITKGDVGVAGERGFGVGVYPGDPSALNLSGLDGHQDVASENYGNYIHKNGSIMVFIPKFYYRIGDSSAPQYGTYGANTVEIKGIKDYPTESDANVDGYVLPRAFINGGQEKSGFFVDKYIASQASYDSNISVSVYGGVPISLTTSTSYTRSNTMAGCDGQLKDAVKLSRDRGTNYTCESLFQRAALGFLSMAHGQVATSDTYCAWYDADGNTNFPKGCNNNSLGDVNDSSVVYESAGDSGSASKPKTGAIEGFAKTTHNGQVNGVADINGSMWQVNIGITIAGSSSTSSTRNSNSDIFILKESVDIAALDEGWSSESVWGDSTMLAENYDSAVATIDLSAQDNRDWGNGNEPAFSSSQNGAARALSGVMPISDAALSASGTNLFGNDLHNRYATQNVAVQSSGGWVDSSLAGVWSRRWSTWRSRANGYGSFRSSAYGE